MGREKSKILGLASSNLESFLAEADGHSGSGLSWRIVGVPCAAAYLAQALFVILRKTLFFKKNKSEIYHKARMKMDRT